MLVEVLLSFAGSILVLGVVTGLFTPKTLAFVAQLVQLLWGVTIASIVLAGLAGALSGAV